MVYGAIDLHMRYSQIRIIDEAGVVQRDQRVPTTRERLIQAFSGPGPMRILLETGTESEWVAQALEAAGHTVVVADPNYAPMYGDSRADQNGSPTCAGRGQLCGIAAHRTSAAQRDTKQICGRRLLVQRNGRHQPAATLLCNQYRPGPACHCRPRRLTVMGELGDAGAAVPTSPR
jgi:transposase